MTEKEPYFFISYVRTDKEIVDAVVAALEKNGIKTWHDAIELTPGESFASAIESALKNAFGIIIFISKASVKSDYVRKEISFMEANGSFILPIVLDQNVNILSLSHIKHLDLSSFNHKPINKAELQQFIYRIANDLKSSIQAKILRSPLPSVPDKTLAFTTEKKELKILASSIADEKRGNVSPQSSETPKSLFIVHGKDGSLLSEVETHINNLGIRPVVLTKIAGAEKSLFQKFLSWGSESRFAIVLISADDFGASREQFEITEVGVHSLQFRARQNVILELGFFYGYLGWENVFVMFKSPDKVFPNFELPSDLAGVVYDSIDTAGNWKTLIEERLKKAGFEI